eukprot:88182_1
MPYFVDKTAHAIQLDIMLYKDRWEHLAHLFGLKNDGSIKSVNYVHVTNINAMSTSMAGRFMSFVFENIPWVDQRIKKKSVIISLQHYHTPSIIDRLNERKRIFCTKNSIPPTDIDISPWSKYKSIIGNVQCKVADLHLSLYDSVEPLDSLDIPYGFILQSLICKLQSNNCSHEWITHLDYVLYKLSHHDHSHHPSIPSNINDKMMQDFGYGHLHNRDEDECITHFNFGIYLHYWRDEYENSVMPMHPTLKKELLNNIYSPIQSSTYYDFYEESYRILQANVIRAQDIGVNNKKFRIPAGSLITINHMIVLKLYTDCSTTQNVFKKHCRRLNQNESLQSIVNRNCQIAHWCRYLKECCTFFGKTMPKNMVVYTGLNEKLMFQSMMQRFEC